MNGGFIDNDTDWISIRVTRYDDSSTATNGIAVTNVFVLASSNHSLSMWIDVIDVESLPANETGVGSVITKEEELVVS